jgi:outer membrane protein assembly factor BamB
MKSDKHKTTIALLMFALISMLFLIPVASAHDPIWEIPSFAYLAAQPTTVGVGQPVSVYMWVDAPMPSAAINNDVRRHDYKLTITDPNGKSTTEQWNAIQDTTGVQYYSFVPDEVGEYTLLFEYAGQVYTWDATGAMRTWTNDVFKPASASNTITVQDEPINPPVTSYPLPTEYWTRPIEGQNTEWWSISSNWLNQPYIIVGDSGTQAATSGCDTQSGYGRFQKDGIGPNSPHVMWSIPMQDAGVVGGSSYDTLGKTYYMGGSYNVRFRDSIVMYGRLYYEESWGNGASGGDYICVDLRTGEEIWRLNPAEPGWIGKPTFGYLYSYDTPNQHGIVPNGWLVVQSGRTTFTWGFYDPRTGKNASLVVENIPRGISIAGPQGEILKYVWDSTNKWLAQWNSSNVFTTQTTGTRDASSPSAYDWNITISSVTSGLNVYRYVAYNDILLLNNQDYGGPRSPGTGADVAAISLDPASRGQVLWSQHYPVAPNNVTRKIIALDAEAGTFVTQDKETIELNGYSLQNGQHLWQVLPADGLWDTMRSTTLAAYGNLYASGFDGILHCYNMTTGDLTWTYGNGGEGNSTYSGLETTWGHYPIFVDVIADGKVYLGTTEHSPGSPFYKDALYRCIDAYTGEELWTIMGWGTGMYVGQSDIVADGFFVFLNCYDMQIYSVGKGPSATTVSAPDTAAAYGTPVVIKGTVMDISAGTQQNEQAARFPYGVPAVSDESMRTWMEYVYMQKPLPTNATGVEVTLSVIDANNNCREIGTTTSDASGFFSYEWTPDISGKYTVIATFAGSESYWPSSAETAFTVMQEPEATSEPTPVPPSVSEQYFVPMSIGMIVAIVVVAALLVLMLLRKRP